MEIKQSTRIQTSLLNGVEKKALVWMASRMPQWVTSDMLTWFGLFGSALCGLGFFLTNYSIYWLWLSCLGLVINWFGDSLDGSLARVHNTQRPLYGYYLDHNIDTVTEAFMFIGAGLSPLMNMGVALLCYAAYLALTVYVSINAHLKSEFKPADVRACVHRIPWFVLLFRRNNPLRHAGHHRNGHPVHPCNLLFRQLLQGSALVRSERSVNQTSERWAGIKA